MAENQVTWDFAYAGGVWQPTRTPQADANLLVAIETLAISFGKRAYAVCQFLEALDGLAPSFPNSGTVNTTTAYVKKSEGGGFEICDKYGQFDNVAISEAELRSTLSALLVRIQTDFPEIDQS
ncbi:hypothetical protein AB0399_09940 [Streptomyces sp. NPDC088194]|uniref:hypothetical protein n=1 Tax=Streptomyces sp. NPDC088194 TaxID=3154931 RepID=UPI00344DC3F2